jgi:hypothetical protein
MMKTRHFITRLVDGLASTCDSKSAGTGGLINDGDTMLLHLAG